MLAVQILKDVSGIRGGKIAYLFSARVRLVFCVFPQRSLGKEVPSFTCPASHGLVPGYLLPVLSWVPGANLCLVDGRLASSRCQKHKSRISVILSVNSAACMTTACLTRKGIVSFARKRKGVMLRFSPFRQCQPFSAVASRRLCQFIFFLFLDGGGGLIVGKEKRRCGRARSD